MDCDGLSAAADSSPDWAGDSAAGGAGKPPDRMVKIEMEAAAALADFALLAAKETEDAGGGSRTSSSGKRVKTESSFCQSELNPVDSSSSPRDLPEDSAVWSPQRHEKLLNATDYLKSEPRPQMSEQSHNSGTSHLFLGGRSRQNLSEADKEAKRLRRVLANRESARRTIRRRQALCEELTRKAAELKNENSDLKKGKEAALNELQMLETRNKQLKAKMEKAVNSKLAATTIEMKPTCGEMPSSYMSFPMLLHNNPLAPFLWPPVFQSPGAVHHVPPALPFIPANFSTQASFKPELPQEDIPQNVTGPRTPVYILPCPWFFTLPNQPHHLESSGNTKSGRDEKPVDSDYRSAPTQTAVSSVNWYSVLPGSGQIEAPGPSRTLLNDLNEIPMDSPPDQCSSEGLQSEEATMEPNPPTPVRTGTIRHESQLCVDLVNGEKVVGALSPTSLEALPEKEQHAELVSGSVDNNPATSNAAAAEARRRRKELTKLKAMHGRPYRLYC